MFKRISCTKLRNILEAKSVNWFVDNLSLEDVKDIKLKLKECSSSVSRKMQNFFGLVEHKIKDRK